MKKAEPPFNPEIVLRTGIESEEECAKLDELDAANRVVTISQGAVVIKRRANERREEDARFGS